MFSKMILKKHERDGNIVIALCDDELIGRSFEDEERQLDLSSEFYNGEHLDEKSAIEAIAGCTSVNAVGKDSVAFLVKHNLISMKNVLEIEKIPYAQAYFM